jgi:hypothetical protein
MRDRTRPAEGDVQLTKPVFTTALNNADGVPEQSRVHLECRLEPINDPNLRVEWFVNGKAIKTGHRFRTTHDFGYVALDILYAYPEDTGTYMCKAVNRLGEAVNTCSVEVIGKSSVQSQARYQCHRQLKYVNSLLLSFVILGAIQTAMDLPKIRTIMSFYAALIDYFLWNI